MRVEVTATLYVTREGVSDDAAIDSLTKQGVFDLLKVEQIDFEAEVAWPSSEVPDPRLWLGPGTPVGCRDDGPHTGWFCGAARW